MFCGLFACCADWRFALAVLAVVVLVTVIFNYLTIGTTITVLSLPVYLSVFFAGWIALTAACVATAAVIWNHRENYAKIRKGNEIGLRSAINKEHRVS